MCHKKPILESDLAGHPFAEDSEWNLVRTHIEITAQALMKAENKDATTIGFGTTEVCEMKDKHYYFSKSNTFDAIEKSFWEKAIKQFPHCFGTENAYDVLEAFYKINPIFPTIERFRDFLADDRCCYIVEVSAGVVTARTLRVDLFRLITGAAGKGEFLGGLFHANRHFAINDRPLSTMKGGYEIRSISDQLTVICRVFYQETMLHTGKDTYTVMGTFNDTHDLKIVLYHDDSKKLDIFFIKYGN